MKIIHLSDLHFGTTNHELVRILSDSMSSINPDLVVISGDFTQIGNNKEFAITQDFLNRLSCDVICVPGNHDVPAWNIFERFLNPYRKYKKYVQKDLNPVIETDKAIVAGINSARRAVFHWNWANGAISGKQRQHLRDIFSQDYKRWKICTLHHPIHKIDDTPFSVKVFGRKRTLKVLEDLKVDIVLTGHVHRASIERLGEGHHKTIYISASTALSSRTRGQANGFNVIKLEKEKVVIDVLTIQNGDVCVQETHEMKRQSFNQS